MPRPLFSHTLNLRPPNASITRQAVAGVGTILQPTDIIWLTNTSGGPVTLTSAPTMSNGFDGQRVLLVNTSTNGITVQDQGTLAGSNLRLSAASIALGTRDSLALIFSKDIGNWLELTTMNVI